jgi:hypothetical protein
MRADWVVHKHECSGGTGEGFNDRPPIPSTTVSPSATSAVQSLQAGKEVVVHSLKAKPKYNGKLGFVHGNQTSDGRYPVKLYSQAVVLAIKPDNVYQIGVSVQQKDGKPTLARCSLHNQEVCDNGFMDFGAANHVWKLRRLKQNVTIEKLEEIAEFHFAGMKHDDEYEFAPAGPIECQGLKDERASFVLKSLLDYTKDMKDGSSVSIDVKAAIIGLCFYSARKAIVVKPYAVKQLQKMQL